MKGWARRGRARSRRTSACCSKSPATSPRSRTRSTRRRSASSPAPWPAAERRALHSAPLTGGRRALSRRPLPYSGPEARVEAFGQAQQRRPFALSAKPWRIAEGRELSRLPLAGLGRRHDDLATGRSGGLDLQLRLGRALE